MAKRTDSNQGDIVLALRQVGATVFPTHAVGRGFPDLVVGWLGRTYLMEVKDGSRIPSERRLTPVEQTFHENWRGHVTVVESVEDALEAIGFDITLLQE